MEKLSRLGRFLFAIAMAGFGIQCFVHASFVAGPMPGPPWTPGSSLWAGSAAVVLIAAVVCIATEKLARWAAILLAIMLLLRGLLVYAPGWPRIRTIQGRGPVDLRFWQWVVRRGL